MPTDPRLLSVELLTLAAFSLHQRRQRAVPNWRTCEGLHALLEAARALPRRDPWSLPSVEDVSGLAGLLREARAWHKEDGHGT